MWCVASAAALLTPVATPMNLIAMGAAGHRFGDYWRLGLVVMAVFFVVAVFVVPVFLAVQLSASARGFEPPGDLQAGRRPPRRAPRATLLAMCRSIRQLRRAEDDGPATTGEARAAALQYVRKISGFREPSAHNRAAFDAAVADVAAVTARLLAAVGTDVADGPDPFADPATRRAILDARAAHTHRRTAQRASTAAESPA